MDKFLCPDDQHPSESSVNIVFLQQTVSFTIKHEEQLCQMTSFPVCSMARAHQIVIGERERANLVVQLTRFFYIYISIRRGHIPYNALRTSKSARYVLPQSARHNCRKIADSTGKNGFFCPFRKQAIFPAHFSQCALLYSWLQRVLQPLWKAWMGLPHQQLVVAVALRLVGGGWNVGVHAGGSALLQKQQQRGRGVCLSVELGTEHDVPPAPRRPARHASCRWGLLSVEDERPIHMCI